MSRTPPKVTPDATGTGVAGLVLAAYGRQFLIELIGPSESSTDTTRRELLAVSKGRKSDITVGDKVMVRDLGSEQAIIDSVQPRQNQLHRSTDRREKVLAANLDLIALVLAPVPRFSESVVMRVGMASSAAKIALMIIANKSDSPQFQDIESRLACFESLGIPVLRVSAKDDPAHVQEQLAPILENKTTLLMGESGMGKSTLLNLLVPNAGHRTAEISQALGTGRHTTTFSRLFTLDDDLTTNARLIDTPGFQQFGITHLSASEREHAMPEFTELLGHCRFHNCRHINEPGCAIRDALAQDQIDPIRYKIFCELTEFD